MVGQGGQIISLDGYAGFESTIFILTVNGQREDRDISGTNGEDIMAWPVFRQKSKNKTPNYPDWYLEFKKQDSDQGIEPVINPFWAFLAYIVAVHYFCFSLWPAFYWKICVTFNLLDRLTGREFLEFASKVSFSTSTVMLFFFFAAGYNTTNKGATQQHHEPFPIYRRIVKILNKSLCLTLLIWLIFYGIFFTLGRNKNTEYFYGDPYPDLTVKASEVFHDFQAYYRMIDYGFYSVYFPFSVFSPLLFIFIYGYLLIYFVIDNRFPFFVVIEPLNTHFWQKLKSIVGRLKRI